MARRSEGSGRIGVRRCPMFETLLLRAAEGWTERRPR
jgi:hypothetical protein